VDEGDRPSLAREARTGMKLYLFSLLGLIGLLGIPLHQPILFLFFLLFGLFAFAPRRSAETHPRPR
jgi:hypothetical protein